MKILITGFEPFGESSINPSQMLVESLSDDGYDNHVLIKATLPVDQANAPGKLKMLINQHQPEAILAFGLAMGRPTICLERVALNLQDFRIPDNQGVTITDQPIHPNGPAAYFSTLPIRRMSASLSEGGLPATISLTAGAYLCNLIFYEMMHTLALRQASTLAGFIHLPALPEQAADSKKPIPSLGFEHDLKAAKILINELILHNKPAESLEN
jgi:pyroglutamyl-peptidase